MSHRTTPGRGKEASVLSPEIPCASSTTSDPPPTSPSDVTPTTQPDGARPASSRPAKERPRRKPRVPQASDAAGSGKVRRPSPSIRREDVVALPEFVADLNEIGQLVASEKDIGLRIGATADKWIGDARYSRVLNAAVFAAELKRITGIDRTGPRIRDYVEAHREHQFHEQAGEQFPNLELAHLVQLAKSRCSSDAERLELARRVNERKCSACKIRTLAASLHAETTRERRLIDVVPIEAKVRVMDGLDLLHEQADGSVECLIMDPQWTATPTWKICTDLPPVSQPTDCVAHLVECLEVAKAKLAPEGLILLHFRASAFLDPRIQVAIERLGFKDAGEFVWRKSYGAWQDSGTPLASDHEKVILICRREHTPKSCCGHVGSVSPRWSPPTRALAEGCPLHPHQKPVELYEQLIGLATVNGLVVDLFAGSGSAGVVAVRRGCSYVGAELVPAYAEIANERIALAAGEVEHVLDAVNFFLGTASPEQFANITRHLGKSGLACSRRIIKGVAA